MLKKLRNRFLALVGALLFGSQAMAANLPLLTGPYDPGNALGFLNALIQEINSNLSTVAGVQIPKNALDNAAMKIDIRGTGIQTCGTTSGVPETAYSADRWGCDVNVASGAGRTQVATATPSPPPGFQNEVKLYRTSGALTQPVCSWQEVATYKTIAMQGQAVVFSGYIAALAGLAADNGNAANLVVIYGTGTDEGLGALRSAVGMTASPAITPAFTGLTTLVNAPITLTTSWARYNSGIVALPATATEAAVGICFTPTATGAGTTDGLAFVGMQFEAMGPNATGPSGFENKTLSADLLESEQYAYALPEAASGVAQVSGQTLSTTSAEFAVQFPVPMAVAPTLSQIGTAITSGTTYKVNQAGTLYNISAMATATANATTGASFTTTVATMSNASGGATLQGLAGGAIPMWGADF